MTITYQINFFSYWHVGSGLAGAANIDSSVHKDRDGFPFIPGKTLKGLIREGAETINAFNDTLITQDFIDKVFGKAPEKEGEDNYRRGADSFFSNAYVSSKIASMNKGLHSSLYETKASTSIDSKGIAVNNTLRQIEVTIPLSLYATIENFSEEQNYKEQLSLAMKWVKRIGVNRTRGLGNCQISIMDKNNWK